MSNKIVWAAIILIALSGVFYWLKGGEKMENVQMETPVEEEVSQNNNAEEEKMAGYTMTEVQKHNTASDCWAVVNGSVYNFTSWISEHPGGAQAIINMCGKDGSAAFNAQHGSFAQALEVLLTLKIGVLAQ